jgi:hypothetical protein
LQHSDEEIAERFVVIPFEGEVLTVLQATTGEKDREVRVVVNVGITKVAAVEDHRSVKQSLVPFGLGGEVVDKLAQ